MAGLAILCAATASAQTRSWTGNGFVNINGGYQSGDRMLTQSLEVPLFDETAVYDITHSSGGGGLFDVTGGVRVWRSIAAAFGVTIASTSSTVEVTGSIPSPLFFNSPRSATLRQTDLTHRQVGFHFQAVYVIPVRDRIDVAISGGPSVVRVEQDLVGTVTLGPEVDPFDTVSITGVGALSREETGVGVNFGVDVTYMLTDMVGAGGFFRYAGGSVDFTVGTGTQSVDFGGSQVGAGLRLRF